MADRFGALELPAPAPSTGQAAGDPALDAFGAYLTAVLNSALQAAWSAVAPGQLVVQKTSKCSPEDGAFHKENMPILFVWRGDAANEHLTDDWVEKRTKLHVMWVTRPAEQSLREKRSPIYNAVANAIERAIERGRDPAWVDSQDTDPDAATLGSLLMTRAGLFQWPLLESAKPAPITIQIDEQPPVPYWAVSGVIEISEILAFDAAARGTRAIMQTAIMQTDLSTGRAGLILNLQKGGDFNSDFDASFSRIPAFKSFSSDFSADFS